ncbi:phosphatidylserine/phosphatidylglycerophosphate/cardiolipin synthase family protein [Deinococcus malanensis]|uniref:phospholipase D-like domain-containing protein n=1 Tax=Deinococcus malanensis TaxID=1706855 RepID=UPI0036267AF0
MAVTDPNYWFLGPDKLSLTPHYTSGNAVEALIDGAAYFTHLAGQLDRMEAGDEVHLSGWRVTASERLRPDLPGSPTLAATLGRLSARGVRVRALLWRFPFPPAGWILSRFRDNVVFARQVRRNGGEAVLDGRLRRDVPSSHHQKAVVLRSGEQVQAYVGGIDLCRGRWDTPVHAERPKELQGDFESWHDVQCVVTGQAATQVWDNFTQRWNDRTLPGRFDAPPSPIRTPRPEGQRCGQQHVQVLRTLASGVYPFAPQGDQSLRQAYERAIEQAEHYIYIEDQLIWPSSLTERLCDAAARGVKVMLVMTRVYELPGVAAFHNTLRHQVLEQIRSAAPHNVHLFHLRQRSRRRGIYLHSKLLVVDNCFAIVGSMNVSRRSCATDSELALAVVDGQTISGRMGANGGRLRLCPEFAAGAME